MDTINWNVTGNENVMPNSAPGSSNPPEVPDCTDVESTLAASYQADSGIDNLVYLQPSDPIPIQRKDRTKYRHDIPWEIQVRPPSRALTGRPPEHEEDFWPEHYINQPSLPSEPRFPGNKETFTDPKSVRSTSPVSFKRPNPTGEQRFVRPKMPRTMTVRSEEADQILVKCPDTLRQDRDIAAWYAEILKNGVTMAGVQDGLKLFARKLNAKEIDANVLNHFSVYIDATVVISFEIRSFYDLYQRHLCQRDVETLRAEVSALHKELERKDDRVKDLEREMRNGLDL